MSRFMAVSLDEQDACRRTVVSRRMGVFSSNTFVLRACPDSVVAKSRPTTRLVVSPGEPLDTKECSAKMESAFEGARTLRAAAVAAARRDLLLRLLQESHAIEGLCLDCARVHRGFGAAARWYRRAHRHPHATERETLFQLELSS